MGITWLTQWENDHNVVHMQVKKIEIRITQDFGRIDCRVTACTKHWADERTIERVESIPWSPVFRRKGRGKNTLDINHIITIPTTLLTIFTFISANRSLLLVTHCYVTSYNLLCFARNYFPWFMLISCKIAIFYSDDHWLFDVIRSRKDNPFSNITKFMNNLFRGKSTYDLYASCAPLLDTQFKSKYLNWRRLQN